MQPAVSIALVLGLALLAGLGCAGAAAVRRMRRRRLMQAPFPRAWSDILDANLPPYRHLHREDRKRLHGLINIFLGEKRFEGCGGLELTDEIRVTIAAQACLLVLGRPGRLYPRLNTVLVYPSTYVAGKGGLFTPDGDPSVRLGESWNRGSVVLAWDSVKSGARNFDDGHNVTFHEFAHQLDAEDGATDGAPILDRMSSYRSWARVLSDEYEALGTAAGRGRRSVLDDYGATNPAEFFAVATESFFEEPEQMSRKHPELYAELKAYFRLDPLDWHER